MNGNTPTKSSLNHQSEIKTKKYINIAKKITLLQNLKLFHKHEESNIEKSKLLTITRDNEVWASGYRTENGFLVLKDSFVSPSMTEKTTPCFKNFRSRLVADGIIRNNKLTVNYEFSSPSAAAVQIIGHNANGLEEWKDINGKKLKDIER